MNLKELALLAQKQEQEKRDNERLRLATQNAKERELRERIIAENATKLKELQPQLQIAIKEYEEKLNVIHQIANEACSYINPSLEKIEKLLKGNVSVGYARLRLRGYRLMGTHTIEFGELAPPIIKGKMDIKGPKLVPAKLLSGSVEAYVKWGYGPYNYDKIEGGFIFGRVVYMEKADLSEFNISMLLDETSLETFGQIHSNGGVLKLLDWQNNPKSVQDLIEFSYLHPKRVVYDHERPSGLNDIQY